MIKKTIVTLCLLSYNYVCFSQHFNSDNYMQELCQMAYPKFMSYNYCLLYDSEKVFYDLHAEVFARINHFDNSIALYSGDSVFKADCEEFEKAFSEFKQQQSWSEIKHNSSSQELLRQACDILSEISDSKRPVYILEEKNANATHYFYTQEISSWFATKFFLVSADSQMTWMLTVKVNDTILCMPFDEFSDAVSRYHINKLKSTFCNFLKGATPVVAAGLVVATLIHSLYVHCW